MPKQPVDTNAYKANPISPPPVNALSPQRKTRWETILEWAFIVVVVLGAFTVRVWGMSKVHFWDEAVYLQNAEVICCGKYNYSELDSRPPLLSLLFAALFLVSHSVYAAVIATALLNAVGPALLYFSGRMIVGRIPAAIALLLLAFLPFFVGVFPDGFDTDNTGNSLLSDSPALTLLLLGFLLLLFALRRQGFWRFAIVGFVFALTALMRFAALSTIAILSLLIFFADRRCRALLAGAFGFLVGFVPYLCWSRLRYGSFLETMRRGWTYYQGERQSPLFYATNFGTIFGWITLAGLVMWTAHWLWCRRTPTVKGERTDATFPSGIQSFLWVWAVLALVLFFALPHQEPRYMMPAAPPMFLLAGSGMAVLIDVAGRRIGAALLAGALVLSFLPDMKRFNFPFINNAAMTEEMQVAQYLNSSFPSQTVLYSNFNYPLFGYYTNLHVKELPEAGPRLYDALDHLAKDGILVVYSKAEINPDPNPDWLRKNPHFRIVRKFSNLVVYDYRENVR